MPRRASFRIAGKGCCALSPIFTAMDRAAADYDAVCRKRAEVGKKGGRPKTLRMDKQPQDTLPKQNNQKVTLGTKSWHKEPFGGISKQKNPDNEYEYDTTPAKEITVLGTNVVSSRERLETDKNPLKPKITDHNPEKPTGYFGLFIDDDLPPPDYDPAEAFGGIDEDRPF